MKVLHVITDLNTGGAEKLLTDLVPRLLLRNINCEVALFNGVNSPLLEKLRETGVIIHTFGFKPDYYNPSHLFKLKKLADKFDIIHTHNTYPQLFGALSNIFGKKVWCTTEHTTQSHRNVWWFKPIEKWMYSRYDSIICISKGTLDGILKISEKFKEKSVIIPNGIDLSIYSPSANNSYCQSDKTILTMVGRLSYQKDQATLIRCLTHLPKKFELWLVGSGDTEPQLSKLIDDLDLKERVKLWGQRTDIPDILNKSDIIIQSSHIEGFGLAAVEGMAAHKPVIASDIQGLQDVVRGAGILFPHGDDKSLASEILKLDSNKEYYRSIADSCFERAKEYSIDEMTFGYIKLYNSLLKI